MSENTSSGPVLRFRMKPWWARPEFAKSVDPEVEKRRDRSFLIWLIATLQFYLVLRGFGLFFLIFLPFHLYLIGELILSPWVAAIRFTDNDISVTYGWLDPGLTLKWREINGVEIIPVSPAARNSYKAVFNGNRHCEIYLGHFVDPEVIVSQLKQKGKAYGFTVIDHRSSRFPTVVLELDENFLAFNHLDVSKTAFSWEDIRGIELSPRASAGDGGEETGIMILIRGKRKDYRAMVDEVTEEQRGQMKLQGELLGFPVILGTGESDKRVG